MQPATLQHALRSTSGRATHSGLLAKGSKTGTPPTAVLRFRRRSCDALSYKFFKIRVDFLFDPGYSPGPDLDWFGKVASIHPPSQMVAAIGDTLLLLKIREGQEAHTSHREAISGDLR